MDAKLLRRHAQPNINPFIQTGSCRHYAAGARQALQQRLVEERTASEEKQGHRDTK
jgi:hypothetical protein